MRALLAAVIFLTANIAAAQGLVGLVSDDAPAREATFGVAGIATENATGRSLVTSPSTGVGVKALIGGEVDYGSGGIESEYGSFSSESDLSITRIGFGAAIPVNKIAGAQSMSGVGIGVSRLMLGTESESDNGDSSADSTYDTLRLTGSLGLGAANVGLAVHNVLYNSKGESTYSYESGDDIIDSESDSKGKGSFTNFTLGVGFTPAKGLRLAFQYRPKHLTTYKTKEDETSRNRTTGEPIPDDGDDTSKSLLGETETISVAGSFAIAASPMKLLAGLEREVPYTESYDIDGSEVEESYDGMTTLSVGLELGRSGAATPRFGFSNGTTRNGTVRHLDAGADILMGGMVLALGAGYDMWDFEADEDVDLKYSAFSLRVGVGANL